MDSTFNTASFYLFSELESLISNNLLSLKYKFPFLNESIEVSNFFKQNVKFAIDYRLAQDYESHELIPENPAFDKTSIINSSSYATSNKSIYTKDIRRMEQKQAKIPKMKNKKGSTRIFFFISGNDAKFDPGNILGIDLSTLVVKYKLRFQYKVFYNTHNKYSGDPLANLVYKMASATQSANTFQNFNLVKSGIIVSQSGDMYMLKEYTIEEDLSVNVIDDLSFYVDLKYDDSGTQRDLPLLAKSAVSGSLESKE